MQCRKCMRTQVSELWDKSWNIHLFIMGQILTLWTLLKCYFLWKVVIQAGPDFKTRLYHTCMHTYTQAYLEGRGAALSHLLTLAIPPLGPSLHHFPPPYFLPLKCQICLHYAYPRDFCKSLISLIIQPIVIRLFSINTHIVQIRAERQGLPVCSGSFTALLDEQSPARDHIILFWQTH